MRDSPEAPGATVTGRRPPHAQRLKVLAVLVAFAVIGMLAPTAAASGLPGLLNEAGRAEAAITLGVTAVFLVGFARVAAMIADGLDRSTVTADGLHVRRGLSRSVIPAGQLTRVSLTHLRLYVHYRTPTGAARHVQWLARPERITGPLLRSIVELARQGQATIDDSVLVTLKLPRAHLAPQAPTSADTLTLTTETGMRVHVTTNRIEMHGRPGTTTIDPHDVRHLALVHTRKGAAHLALHRRTGPTVTLAVRFTPRHWLFLKAVVEVIAATPDVQMDRATYRVFGRPPYGVLAGDLTSATNRPPHLPPH